MTEAEANICRSLLDTLLFLASESAQREFAKKRHYASYQGEFACWWFDTFFPEEPSTLQMFTGNELVILRAFSESFDGTLTAIGMAPLSIEELLAKPEWKTMVAMASETCVQLSIAAQPGGRPRSLRSLDAAR